MGIDFDLARRLNPLPDYCERRGIKLRRSGNSLVGKCPMHGEVNGSAFVVFGDGHWRCFGMCGKYGDVIDLELELGGGTLAEAAERLGAQRMQRVAREPKTPEQEAKPVISRENPLSLPYRMSRQEIALCIEAATRLAQDATQVEKIARWRGWKPDTIRNLALEPSLGIDGTGRLCFLYASVCKLRWRDNGERRIRWAFGKPWLWRFGYIKQAETVIVTEGETDAVTLVDSGVEQDGKTLVVALPSASFRIERWASLFAGTKVTIATDSDEAGVKATEHLARALSPVSAIIKRLELEGSTRG